MGNPVVYNVTDETDLQNAIKAIDLASQANAGESTGVNYEINFMTGGVGDQ